MGTDFANITPCGGDCGTCDFFVNGECEGCLKTSGKCVKMWEKGCDIYRCCAEHNVKFCGLCDSFPCEWISEKLTQWDKDGIQRQKRLADEYRGQ